jgi:hypothetical protein
VDEMNKAGYSAIMLGALCELKNETEIAIIQRLFQMGNVNAKALKVFWSIFRFEIPMANYTRFKHRQTALMLASAHGRVETTNLLLDSGADVNIQVGAGKIFTRIMWTLKGHRWIHSTDGSGRTRPKGDR